MTYKLGTTKTINTNDKNTCLAAMPNEHRWVDVLKINQTARRTYMYPVYMNAKKYFNI